MEVAILVGAIGEGVSVVLGGEENVVCEVYVFVDGGGKVVDIVIVIEVIVVVVIVDVVMVIVISVTVVVDDVKAVVIVICGDVLAVVIVEFVAVGLLVLA